MAAPTYRERLSVPLRWWAQGVMLVIALWLAFAVALPVVWSLAATALALLIVVLMFVSYGAATITVADGWLHAGSASVSLEYVSEVRALDREETRAVAGPRADARAYLVPRPYRHRAVQVILSDPADPTPYWLLSSKRPERLAAALDRPVP